MPHSELHAIDGVEAGGGVEDFEGDELTGRVIVEDHAGPFFLAFADGRVLQDDPERVGLGVVVDPHGATPYLRNCVVAYTVMMAGGETFSSMTIRKRACRGGEPTSTCETVPDVDSSAKRASRPRISVPEFPVPPNFVLAKFIQILHDTANGPRLVISFAGPTAEVLT